jgi:hypothetical protein
MSSELELLFHHLELVLLLIMEWQGMVRQWQESFMEIDFRILYEKWNA